MKNYGYFRNLWNAVLAILSISEIALSFRLSIRGTPLYGQISKYAVTNGVSTYNQQGITQRKKCLSAVIADSKGVRGGSLISPLLRRLKWFVTLIKHIIQLIVRSFANIDKEEKKSEADKRMPDIPEADEELPELKGAGLLITEKENVQRIVKAEPRIASSYVPNHERKEADKTYAERKLQEIENLQIEAQNSRMARKAKAERDVMWAQSSLNNSEKRVYSDSDGGERGSSSNGMYDKNRSRNVDADIVDITSTGGKSPDTPNISKTKDAIKKMKATNKDIIKSSVEVEEEKDLKMAKTEPVPEVEAPTRFSSKPNLNVILKKSLKDSLYSINVNGFYSNNGSAFAETKNTDLIPLVRNSLLLSEKVEFEKKMVAKKNTDAVMKDITQTLEPTVGVNDENEITKIDTHSNEYKESPEAAEVESNKQKSGLVIPLQDEETLQVDDNEYLLPPALQPDRDMQANQGKAEFSASSFAPVFDSNPLTFGARGGAVAEEGQLEGEPTTVMPHADGDRGVFEEVEGSAVSESLPGSEEGGDSRQYQEESGRQVPDYDEESIERLLQKQQAEEYEEEFLDSSALSSASPSAATLASPPSFASFSSPSDESYPLSPPLSLLGEWELAEQRYLDSDRSLLSDFYMDTISFPSFGSLSSSLSGSKGTEWGTKKRSKEESGEVDDLEAFAISRSGVDSNPDSEEYEVEFNVIRGCSSTEWMKGQGRQEKTITARIIKPPKEAYEQRPTLCTYTGVLTSPNSIRGYVYSTAITIEGEKQLVGEFEMIKMV